MDKSKELIDNMDELSKMAKSYGYSCTRDWACKAAEEGVISISQKILVENLIDLRNTLGHGNSRYVTINGQAIEDLKGVVKIMSKSEKEKKMNKSKDTRKKTKSIPKLPEGTFRTGPGRPFSKEFQRKGADGESYYFSFTIKDEGAQGFIIYINKASYFGKCKEFPHDFHILNGFGPEPYVCWENAVRNFQDANAIMVVWVKNYVQTLDRFKKEGKIKVHKKEHQKPKLPEGTFR